jgi:hypothetical protein
MAGVPEVAPAMPGMGLGAGGGGAGVAPELSPEQAVEYRAGAVLGEQGIQAVQQLRQQGVPEDQIRARLGMQPAPVAPGAALTARPAGAGMGMMRRPKEPELPPSLQRPYETLYPEDWAARVYEAEAAGQITPEQAEKLHAGYQRWQASPEGAVAATQAHQREGLAELGRIEQDQVLEEQRRQAQQKALYEQQLAKNTAEAAAQKAWQEDYDTELQEQTARYEGAIEEAKRARIDPDRARVPIVDALAAAAGQFAAIMTGTPNAALQQINARLDRDVAAQEQTIRGLQTNVAMRRNRLGLLRERLGDRQAAMAAEKRLQLEQVQTQLQRIASESKIEQNRLGAAKLATELDIQIQAMRDDENQRNALASQELAAMRHQQRLASANALALQRQRAQQQAEMQASGMGPWQTKGLNEVHKKYVPGLGIVPSEKQAIDLNEKLQDFGTISAELNELASIGAKSGSSFSPKDRARAQALTSHLFGMIKKPAVLDLGVIAGADLDLIKGMVDNPTQVGAIGVQERLKQTAAIIDAQKSRTLRGVQAIPAEMATIVDPKTGAPKPAYRLALPGRGPAPAKPIAESPVAP